MKQIRVESIKGGFIIKKDAFDRGAIYTDGEEVLRKVREWLESLGGKEEG